MRKTVCDRCGGEIRVGDRAFHVERLEVDGVSAMTLGEHPGPWDFCSALCLETWTGGVV